MSMILMFAVVGIILVCLWAGAASTITPTFSVTCSVIEALGTTADPFVSSSAKSTTHNGLGQSPTLSPASLQGFDELALSSGAGTINLAAIPGIGGSTGDGTGMKVQGIVMKNKTDNANSMTITVGASNGYDLMGSAMSITLQPGQWIAFYGNDATPDIASGDRTIDIAGTGAQVLQYHAIMG